MLIRNAFLAVALVPAMSSASFPNFDQFKSFFTHPEGCELFVQSISGESDDSVSSWAYKVLGDKKTPYAIAQYESVTPQQAGILNILGGFVRGTALGKKPERICGQKK